MAEEPQRPEQEAGRSRSRRPLADDDPDLDPIDEDAEDWAARERERRRAWLEGPTDAEKRAWARSRQREAGDLEPGLAASGPTDEEVEEWAARERERRRAWAEGPTDAEKRAWARSRRGRGGRGRSARRGKHPLEDALYGPPSEETMRRIWREGELATKGLFSWLTGAPYSYWDDLVESGLEEEAEYEASGRPPRRIRLYSDY